MYARIVSYLSWTPPHKREQTITPNYRRAVRTPGVRRPQAPKEGLRHVRRSRFEVVSTTVYVRLLPDTQNI